MEEHRQWELELLSQVYNTDFFISQKLEVDYSTQGLLDLYIKFIELRTSDIEKLVMKYKTEIKLNINYNLIQLSEKLKDMDQLQNFFEIIKQIDKIMKYDEDINQIIVFSNLRKCKILPKLVKQNNLQIIKQYKQFICQYQIKQFDKTIMTKRYISKENIKKQKDKVNDLFWKYLKEKNIDEIVKWVQKDKQILDSIEYNCKERGLEHLICEEWPLKLIKELVEKIGRELNFNKTDKDGSTGVFYVIGSKKSVKEKVELTEYLLETYKIELEHLDNQDRNCLYWACCDNCDNQQESIEVIEYLIGKGCNINQHSKLQRSGLSKACYLCLDQVVEYLLKNKDTLHIDIDQQDNKGRTPLHNSCWGSKGGIKGKYNGTVLMGDSAKCGRLLIQYGCQVDKEDYQGCTPLFSACTSEALDSIQMLLQHGQVVTPFILLNVVHYGHYKVLQLLNEHHHYTFTPEQYTQYFQTIFTINDAYSKSSQLDIYSYLLTLISQHQHITTRHHLYQRVYEEQLQQDNIQPLWEELARQLETTKGRLCNSIYDHLLYKLNEEVYQSIYWRVEGIDKAIQVQWLATHNRLHYITHLDPHLSLPSSTILHLVSIATLSQQHFHWVVTKAQPNIHQLLDHQHNNILHLLINSNNITCFIYLLNHILTQEQRQIMLEHKNQQGMDVAMLCAITKRVDYSLVLSHFTPLQYTVPEQHYQLVSKGEQEKKKEQLEVEQQLVQLNNKTQEHYPTVHYQQVDSLVYLDTCQQPYVHHLTQIATHPLIAVDTEFTIYSTNTFTRGVICLIQISTPHQNYILDIQVLRTQPLFSHLIQQLKSLVLENINVRKVMHGCDNDIKYLNQDLQVNVVNVVDTARLDKLIHHHPQYKSLQQLCVHYLSLHIDKQLQQSEWRIRPLFTQQLHYAVQDSRIMLSLYQAIITTYNQTQQSHATIWNHHKPLSIKGFQNRLADPNLLILKH